MQTFRIVVACLVVAVWLVGYVLAYITGGANPTELSGLMALVLGWATAGELRDTIKKKVTVEKNKDAHE